MALVEIARFLDISEAQAAAASLRASDIPVFLQNEHWGQTEAYLQLAMGGFRLWVPEEEAEDARAYVEQARTIPNEAPDRGGLAQTAAAVVVTFLLGPVSAWLVMAFRRRRARRDDA
jgi:hypothetical protein